MVLQQKMTVYSHTQFNKMHFLLTEHPIGDDFVKHFNEEKKNNRGNHSSESFLLLLEESQLSV